MAIFTVPDLPFDPIRVLRAVAAAFVAVAVLAALSLRIVRRRRGVGPVRPEGPP